MPHPNETMIREAYAAFGRGDFDGYLRACTDDWTFNVPGTSRVAGSYRGREGLMQIVEKIGQIAGTTFVEEVHDVLANDEHGVVLAIHRFEAGGRPREYRTAHVYHIRDGKLAECWEQPQDQAAFDAAWG